ncbi:protein-glutamate O-methyltransferase CheR [Candidatus Poribacteria bacterium]|nr:protein-glutamate O-methyltransferase CheR [Candidatus Poribacteria bacterium]
MNTEIKEITGRDPYFKKILLKIKEERNLDFLQYRESILWRRIMTRARIAKRENLEQYLAYLEFHPDEMDNLMDAITINITEFFRNPNVFESIEKKIIPELILQKQKNNSNVIRIWSCGCSSGEEAISILILLAEFLGTKLFNYKIIIQGTDIDNKALAQAKEGVYEEAQFKNWPINKRYQIEKYFYDIGNKRYWIREEWPAYLSFIYHDVIDDVPLEHMDMVVCRNLLIYFSRELQRQVIEHLFGSLNKGGFLVLGNVESIWGDLKNKFIEVDAKSRIYMKE